MIKLKILDLLNQQNHTKYWLYTQMDMSYQNLNRLINNETKAIRYENIEKLCSILNCTPADLFEIIPEKKEP